MRILGISAYFHDSAAAIIEDGRITAAAQEERFTRKKRDAGFPRNAVAFCLERAGIGLEDVDALAIHGTPPRKDVLDRELGAVMTGPLFVDHHLSHAASAFYPSPFEDAVVLTMDGADEKTTASVAIGRGNSLEVIRKTPSPHSLGLLYSAFTHYTGFRVNSGEYKVMGLAPYGEPRYRDLILDRLIDLEDDGSFRLDQSYFDGGTGLTMTNRRFDALFGGPPRRPDEPLSSRHMDLAASIQAVTEEVMVRTTRHLAAETGQRNLCLAGGVALNCVANGKILRDGRFEGLWIQPAAGDAGGALGAALTAYHCFHGRPRIPTEPGDSMAGAYLGPDFAQGDIESRLAAAGARFSVLDGDHLIAAAARALAAGKAIGWFQGRMEFGPRALGARSILGDARSPTMQKTLNLKVKYRESFRPFAPSVLAEDVAEWFDLQGASPYMLLVAHVRNERRRAMTDAETALFGIDKLNVVRSDIPAVTHVDYSARIQTVHAETNPRYHALISAFKALTGCPVVVNTSFNVRGEPIVCTPEDAWRCFMGTDIEALAIGDCWLLKEDQDPALALNYRTAFELD
ncbi:MAG: carbamoyltransferase [Rhodospirillales bacterium]|nr:carbamoyltransferase [Rhodospirillales bacterium]